MIAPEMRSPAPRANAENRAEVIIRNDTSPSKSDAETEADFTSNFIASRYRLPLPIAALVARLAELGGALS